MYYSDSPFDTDVTRDLREHINRLEEEENRRRRQWAERQRERVAQYEAMMLAQRPTYPTPEQVEALDLIAAMVHGQVEYGDHLGHPRKGEDRLPGKVDFLGRAGVVNRINVFAQAPYKNRSPARIWVFTEAEIAAMQSHLEANDLVVVSEWSHEDGHAFVVTPKKTTATEPAEEN